MFKINRFELESFAFHQPSDFVAVILDFHDDSIVKFEFSGVFETVSVENRTPLLRGLERRTVNNHKITVNFHGKSGISPDIWRFATISAHSFSNPFTIWPTALHGSSL